MKDLYIIKLGYYNKSLDLFEVKYELAGSNIELEYAITDELLTLMVEQDLVMQYTVISAKQAELEYVDAPINLYADDNYYTYEELKKRLGYDERVL